MPKIVYSCTYLIIITSEMIFTVFLQIFFKPIFRNKIDPMPENVALFCFVGFFYLCKKNLGICSYARNILKRIFGFATFNVLF
jgi:hypothetical protein